MYRTVTNDVEVAVTPHYLEGESNPSDGRYVWAYTVDIANHRPEPVQLRSRYWKITDGLGRVQEVRGPGVVGEEPVIAPGGRFSYSSGCPLTTPSGFMVGCYNMQAQDGTWFTVDIPAFSLDLPDDARVVN